MSELAYANIVALGMVENHIFDLAHVQNRDDCFQPYYLTREKMMSHSIQLNTSELNELQKIAFELHLDVQNTITSIPSYLLMLESTQIYRANGIESNWDNYRKVFTWNDDLVDGIRFIKIHLPNLINIHQADGFTNRNHFCCLIAGNKALSTKDERNLYPERVKAIRWFEQHAPQDFDLYGTGWNMPEATSGLLGRLMQRFCRLLSQVVCLQPFSSYRGKVSHKRDVLKRTRFAICYENVRDIPGYITEKIFDCFFSGCIPVYWGANNITDYIPADCFIDRRQFQDTEAVYRHLKAMPEQAFIQYQQRIADFLKSDAAYLFSSEHFAETIVNTVVQDLGV